jgi:hypothetical protein
MRPNKRIVKPLVLAGLAAAAYYAYTRLTPEQKENLFGSIKKQGKDLLGKLWPAGSQGHDHGDTETTMG